MQKQWQITVEGKTYQIELDHTPLTNVQTIRVNESVIYTSPGRLQIGGVTRFLIDGHECAVFVSNKLLGFDYDMVVDGVSSVTKKKVKLPPGKPIATIENGVVQKRAKE